MSAVTFRGHLLVILCKKAKSVDMKKILLVEDDDLLNKTLTYNLISEGYVTVSALNAGTAAE